MEIFKNLILFILLFTISQNHILGQNKNSIIKDENIYTISEDDEFALLDAIEQINEKGGYIYIDTPVININDTVLEISGTLPGGIIGIRQFNGQYPRIDFKYARDTQFGSCIIITGSNQLLKYLIIENSLSAGIVIYGNKNSFVHIITRYNSDSGIEIYDEADSNIFEFCYSYRNCNIKKFGHFSNGFTFYGGYNTIFNYCFAWDNIDSGFNAYENKQLSSNVTFRHCASWNNGNVDVFSGKYDYDNGKTLDKKMLTVQQMIESDENFEDNYIRKRFNLDNAKINGRNAFEWISVSSALIDGFGIKVGTKKVSLTTIKIADYTAVFDNKNNGFDNEGSQKCSGYFTNCASFNNYYNYLLPYNFIQWNNNWSWGANKGDKKDMDEITRKPKNTNTASKLFYSIREQIVETVYSNNFPENFNFDKAINSLSE